MEITRIESYIKSLVNPDPSKYSIEDLILNSIEVLNHVLTPTELSVKVRIKVHPAWLNTLNQLSPSCLLSIIDSATVVFLLLFTKKGSTSISIQLSINNPIVSGDYLLLNFSGVPKESRTIQAFVEVRDQEKLLATATHFKLFLGFNYPNL